jgi:hypothetical protein
VTPNTPPTPNSLSVDSSGLLQGQPSALNSRPIRSTQHNKCPVCNGSNGACRILPDETIFCHGFADAKKFEKVNGYVCIAPARGHTATFKLDNSTEWTEDRRREWEARKVARQQAAKEEEQIRQARALSADERHQLYSEILDQLAIDKTTLADLQRRGFTPEEIERSGFKSVRKWQPLNKKYDTRLPGVSEDGSFLVVGGDGYLCPLRDFEGRIIGVQLRLHSSEDGDRYRWLSTPKRASLKLQPEDENPLAVFHPPGGKPEGIAILEGTGCKPFFVSRRLNFLTIGAAGGHWLGSPKLLEKYIKAAIEKYGQLPIKLVPDAGWALNSQVKAKLSDTLNWLEEKFTKKAISVLDWNQVHKSQYDIDELEDLSIVRSLTLESFSKKYKEVFASNKYQKWAENRVKLTADIVQQEKWLSIPKGIENECDILFIRKSLGGGKTQALIDYLKSLGIGIVSLLVGYRNTLLENTIARANALGLSASHVKNQLEKVGGHYVNFAADSSIELWAGCADSYFKFNAIIDHNPEYFFIHDEICSVLGHLKGGGTLKGRQQQAIQWDVESIRNSKFAIMMDANLSDREVDFMRSLFPEKRIKVLDSINDPNPRTFYFLETESSSNDYSQQPKYLPAQLVEKAKAATKVLWISDSQRSCEIADEILTRHGHKHYRLDGKTSTEELSKLLQSNPKEFIVTEQLDSLSLSPSAESGLSIDLFDYFDIVCFDIRGTLGVNALTQISTRLRDTKVPIYVACPEFVNLTSDPCPYAMKNVGEVIQQRIDMLAANATDVDRELITREYVANLFSEMGQKFSKDPWFIESLKDAKELKYEHQNLKLMLKTALAQAGNKIIDCVDEVADEQCDEVEDVKEFVKRREAEKIFNSIDIDYEKALELDKKDVNFDVKCQIRKARLKHQLPGIEETPSWNADFVYAVLLDQPDFLKKRWRLKRFQSEELGKAIFKAERKYNFEFGFEPKDVWKATSTKLHALKLLGVDRIIDIGSFSSQEAWVQEIIDKYYDNPEWFNLIGITKAKKSLKDDGTLKSLKHVKTMVERFLDYFGLESQQSKKGERNRTYAVATPELFDYILPDIDECLERRAAALIEEMSEISLSAIAAKAEEVARQQKAAEEQNQVELNKRMLEVQLTHSESGNPGNDSSYIYISNEIVARNLEEIPEEWNQPGQIEKIASWLAACETLEMLRELRGGDTPPVEGLEKYVVPPAVFKAAARGLEPSKRKQIKDWVLVLNSEKEGGTSAG